MEKKLLIQGINRAAALYILRRDYKNHDFEIGKIGYNRIAWKHEHEGYEIVGEYSPYTTTANKRHIVYAIYRRLR